jgi:hypothetical protein
MSYLGICLKGPNLCAISAFAWRDLIYVLSRYLLEGTGKPRKTMYSRCSSWDANWAYPEHGPRTLPLDQPAQSRQGNVVWRRVSDSCGSKCTFQWCALVNTAMNLQQTNNSVALVPERTIPTERPPLLGEAVPTFADRGCCVVSATDSHGR